MGTRDLIGRVARVAARPARMPRGPVALLAALAAVAATAVGASALTTPPPRSSQPVTDGVHDIVSVGLGRSAPVRIVIPSIAVDAEVVPLALEGGVLAAPRDARRAGWYERGTSPGEVGSAVIVGRAGTERRGVPAVFGRLDRVVPGDQIRVVREDGAVAPFVVDRVEGFAVEVSPRDPVAEAQLRLVSREVVVWATFVPDTTAAYK